MVPTGSSGGPLNARCRRPDERGTARDHRPRSERSLSPIEATVGFRGPILVRCRGRRASMGEEVSPATGRPAWSRLSEDGEIVLAGLIEVDRGVGFEAYIEPELERMTDRLDGRRGQRLCQHSLQAPFSATARRMTSRLDPVTTDSDIRGDKTILFDVRPWPVDGHARRWPSCSWLRPSSGASEALRREEGGPTATRRCSRPPTGTMTG